VNKWNGRGPDRKNKGGFVKKNPEIACNSWALQRITSHSEKDGGAQSRRQSAEKGRGAGVVNPATLR